jgi:hypothetical protein
VYVKSVLRIFTQETEQPMSENCLDGYISQRELVAQLKKSIRALQDWEKHRMGPPVTRIGDTPYYRIDAVRQWLRSRERNSASFTVTV